MIDIIGSYVIDHCCELSDHKKYEIYTPKSNIKEKEIGLCIFTTDVQNAHCQYWHDYRGKKGFKENCNLGKKTIFAPENVKRNL